MAAKSSNVIEEAVFHGRPKLVEEIWRALRYSSVFLVGPAGVGKTFLLRQIERDCLPKFECMHFNGHGKTLSSLREEIVQKLSIGPRGHGGLTSLITSHRSFLEGKATSLVDLVRSSVRRLEPGVELLLIIDDFSEALIHSDEIDGRRLPDELRHIRMSMDNVKMIISGRHFEGIGSRFNDIGFFNDLHVISVGPLSRDEARAIVGKAMEQTKYSAWDVRLSQLSDQLYEVTAGSPVLLNLALQTLEKVLLSSKNSFSSDELIKLVKPETTFKLEHFVEDSLRNLKAQHSPHEAELIDAILDKLALSDGELRESELARLLPGQSSERNNLRMLRMLEQNGIVARHRSDGVYFAHKAISDWWAKRRRREEM